MSDEKKAGPAPAKANLYRALKRGFDGKVIREKDEKFEFTGAPGDWMKLVENDEVQEGPTVLAPPKMNHKKEKSDKSPL